MKRQTIKLAVIGITIGALLMWFVIVPVVTRFAEAVSAALEVNEKR